MTDDRADYVRRAAELMAEATSHFVLADYAVEGLEALAAAGWTLTPPDADQRAVPKLLSTTPVPKSDRTKATEAISDALVATEGRWRNWGTLTVARQAMNALFDAGFVVQRIDGGRDG